MSHKPDPNKNVNLIIDGKPVTVPEGTSILDAAKTVNINIPVLCDHPDLHERALCRICVVECDGRGKLAAACANDVWEGVSIVTNNKRLSTIRKTIVEMLLANHPRDCLKCVRSTNCELQSLALKYNIFSSSFENDAKNNPPLTESETLVRDMDKCVKCTRCVEACQGVQTIGAINTARRSHEFEICAPFKQSLSDVSCVFCGGCASVCPVGAIYEHDQTAEVWKAVNNSGVKTIAQIAPALASALGDVPIGKLAAAVRLMGFDKVYDASVAANAANAEKTAEIKTMQKKPLVSGCAEGVNRFIKNFYPDLADHLTAAKSVRRTFASLIKSGYAKEAGVDQGGVVSVSFMPCIAQKYTTAPDKTDFALGAKEFLRMIKTAGIIIETLPEEKFDEMNIGLPKQDAVKKETVCGFAQARNVMETIRGGECKADWIEILSCPGGYCK